MGLPLTPGDHGTEITDLRARLARWQRAADAVSPLTEGDAFDAATVTVVQAFQRDRNLVADGVVGPETWQALVETNHALGDRLLWHSGTLMRGDDVLDLQQRLNQLGFDAGLEDGLFGRDVRTAVEEFQANVGLDVDGVVGVETLAALQRLHRGHQATGVGSRLREAEAVRRIARRGLIGLQVMVDPTDRRGSAAPHDEADTSFAAGRRLAGHLDARGARALLSRGHHASPPTSARARMANQLGVDLVISIGLNASDNPAASGAAAYYYGSLRFVSEAGCALASELLDATLAAGLGPDCRVHPMTWSLLRETRMPAVVLEPAFATNTEDLGRFADPVVQDRLVRGLVDGVQAFLARYADRH